MPDPVVIPDEVKDQIAATTGGDPFAALDGLNDEITPPAEETAEVTEPTEESEVETPVVAHPQDLIARAAALMIPADEVAEMTTAELQRVIKHADRVGQAVNDYHAQTKPKEPEPAPAKAQDDLAILDDPEKYDQEFVKPIKTVLAKQAEENRLLRERLEKLEKTQTQTHQQTLHTRLTADLEPEVAKVFDIGTPAGQKKYSELLDKMGLDQRHNSTLSEKQLRARAIKAMELVPEKPKEDPKIVDSKRRWDAAALAKPSARKADEPLENVVERIMREDARNARKPQKQTNGQGGH